MGPHRVSELLSGRRRATGDLARRVDGVLTTHGINDFRDGNIQLGELVGLHPDSHGVLASAENRHLRNTVHTTEGVAQVNVGVVGQELCVPRALG